MPCQISLSPRLALALLFFIPWQSASAQGEPSHPTTLEKIEIRAHSVRDPQWISYRKSYKAMQMFLSHKGAMDQLRPMLRVVKKPSAVIESPLALHLVGEQTFQKIELTNGWGDLPLNSLANDEGADFVLNQAAGSHEFKRNMALQLSADGDYSVARLKQGCEQTMEFYRQLNFVVKLSLMGKRCTGAIFVAQDDADYALGIGLADGSAAKHQHEANKIGLRYRFAEGADDDVLSPGFKPAAVLALIE